MLPLKIQRFLPDQQEPTTSPPCQFYLSFRPSRHLFFMDMYFRSQLLSLLTRSCVIKYNTGTYQHRLCLTFWLSDAERY